MFLKEDSSSFVEASTGRPEVQAQEPSKDLSTLTDHDLESLGLVAEDFRFWWKLEGASWECQLPIALCDCLDYYELQISKTTPHETPEKTLRDNFRRLSITQEAAAEALQLYHKDVGTGAPLEDEVPSLVYHRVVLPRYYKLTHTFAKGPSKSPELPGTGVGARKACCFPPAQL